MHKRNLIPIILTLLLAAALFSGCGSEEAVFENTIVNYEPNYAPEGEYAAEDTTSSVLDVDVDTVDTNRIVIMNAEMTISTWSPEEVVDSISSLAERYGGYVVTSNLSQDQGTYAVQVREAHIKIRVPAEHLQLAIETIKTFGVDVLNVAQSGQDVTKEYTDLQSRLRNLEEAAAQLNEIMDAADETEDVLNVYQELVSVNEEAEVIRGQIQYYEDAAALSSIDVTIVQLLEPTPTPTPWPTATPQPFRPGETFKEAGDDLVTAFQRWINGVIRFFVYFLPTFIFRAGPWLLGLFFLFRWLYRKFVKPAVKE